MLILRFQTDRLTIIVRPETTEEVSEIVKIANKYKIKIVPREEAPILYLLLILQRYEENS
ncbi:MAG TPA: FAD-binding oxidoreductase [bacterium]|nr:FAD-binding oxidoreductase [bacterium]